MGQSTGLLHGFHDFANGSFQVTVSYHNNDTYSTCVFHPTMLYVHAPKFEGSKVCFSICGSLNDNSPVGFIYLSAWSLVDPMYGLITSALAPRLPTSCHPPCHDGLGLIP